METKVKGEAIKKGSIPLSALASGNYMLNNYGVNDGYLVAELTSNNTYFNIYEDKNVVYISATNHNIIELVKGQKTTLSRGPGATITYDNNGIKIDRSYDFYNVKVYREIEHISPDWNAQAGEAGYIENRTHYNIENTILQKIDDKDLGDINIKGYDRIHIIYDYKNGETDYIIIDVKNKYIIDSTLENWKNGYVDYHFNDDSFSLYVDDYDYDVLPNINVIGYITKQLDEKFIPDTVVKTTPQSLSDNNKNQALANLGIADLLEALKPVQLSGDIPVGNATQEQLDEIGLTEKVINNILNGYTNKICISEITYCVTYIWKDNEEAYITFGSFNFDIGGVCTNLYQYVYHKTSDGITIEFSEL